MLSHCAAREDVKVPVPLVDSWPLLSVVSSADGRLSGGASFRDSYKNLFADQTHRTHIAATHIRHAECICKLCYLTCDSFQMYTEILTKYRPPETDFCPPVAPYKCSVYPPSTRIDSVRRLLCGALSHLSSL